jgi:hypothetical protein
MPPLAVLIGTIASAAIGGTELGMGLAGVGQPSQGAAADALKKQEQQQSLAEQQAKQRAIMASLPNAQEQGGGALNSPSLLNLGSVIAGLPGETNTPAGQSALTAFLGNISTGSGSPASTNPQPQNLVQATYGLSGSQEGQ